MFTQFKSTIEALVHFTPAELDKLESSLSFRKVPKNHLLVEENEVANEIYFINKGMLRLYYNNDGDEITAFLFHENLFASSYASFLEQKPSNQILQTLEECELLVLNHKTLLDLYDTLPKMHILTRIVAEQRFINAQRIQSSYILKSPEERYIDFAQNNPDIVQRVPQHIIASFLGITPVSLSRIRRRTLKR